MKKSILVGLMLLGSVAMASASTISYTDTGVGSGTVGGDNFQNAAFTITATGDTTNRQSFVGGFFIDNISASINISGLGDFLILTGTRFFVNNSVGVAGFSRAGSSGADLYNGPYGSSLFSTWDMLSSIGPVSGNSQLMQWGIGDMNTNSGTLIFLDGLTFSTFTADVGGAPVPEPGTIALLGLGMAGLAVYGKRRQNKA